MKQKNRLLGMIVCLIILLTAVSWIVFDFPTILKEIANLLIMFVGGYALRDTLEPKGQKEE